jgi:histidinol-phosphate/aromatic aminotransferase/cobyric acid decarboxylase-like protein
VQDIHAVRPHRAQHEVDPQAIDKKANEVPHEPNRTIDPLREHPRDEDTERYEDKGGEDGDEKAVLRHPDAVALFALAAYYNVRYFSSEGGTD